MIVRVTLRAEPGTDGPMMLKGALKVLLRRFKLRCTRIERVIDEGTSLPDDNPGAAAPERGE